LWHGSSREELDRAVSVAQRQLGRITAASEARLKLLDRLSDVYDAERAIQDEKDVFEQAHDEMAREIADADLARHLETAREHKQEVGRKRNV
jgi:hypothetical protein